MPRPAFPPFVRAPPLLSWRGFDFCEYECSASVSGARSATSDPLFGTLSAGGESASGTRSAGGESVFGARLALVSGARSAPVSEARSAPASGARSAPVSGARSAPVSGARSAPVSGAQSAPVSGARSAPVSGARSAPVSGARSAPVSGARSAVLARESGVRPGHRSAAECAVEARWPGLRLVGRGGHSPSSRSDQDVGVLTGAWAWARWALRASRCWAWCHLLRLILTGVRPSGLRPNTGPNGPGTLVSPSGTDRKLLNGPGSDVN